MLYNLKKELDLTVLRMFSTTGSLLFMGWAAFFFLTWGARASEEVRLLDARKWASQQVKFLFERSSAATILTDDNQIQNVAPNVPRFEERRDANGVKKVGYLSEGPATNYFLNSSFESGIGQWVASLGLTAQCVTGTAIHGVRSVELSGVGRFMHPPVKMPAGNIPPFLSWFVSAYVRRADGKLVTEHDIHPIAARTVAGPNQIQNKPSHLFIERVGDSSWYRVVGYFVPVLEGLLWHIGFEVNGDVYLDAAQLERRWDGNEVVAPTSYIPTEDVPATRVGDSLRFPASQFKWPKKEGTLSLWTRTRSVHHNGDAIIIAQDFADGDRKMQISFQQFGGSVSAGTNTGASRSLKVVNTNHWTWLVVTWKDSRGWLFVDGQLNLPNMVDGFQTNGFVGKPVSDLHVGLNTNLAMHLSGFVADIRILGRVLEPKEIWESYRKEFVAAGGDSKHLKTPKFFAFDNRQPEVPRSQWVKLRFTLPRAGRTSVNIYDKDGRIVRTLGAGVEAAAGMAVAEWDTLNDNAKPVPAGEYTFRVIQADGVQARYIATVGNGRVPQRHGDRGGVHALSPFGVEVDEDGNVYVLGSGHGIGMQKFDSDGKLIWTHTTRDSNDIPTAMTLNGRYIFVAGQHLWRIERETGKIAELEDSPWRIWLGDQPKVSLPPENPYENVEEYWIERRLLHGVRVRGVTVINDKVFVSLYHDNRIDIFNANDFSKIDEIKVPQPAGLAVDADGQLLAVSGTQVIRLAPDGKRMGVVIGGGLVQPWGLAVGPKGDIYVTDLGKSNALKRFSEDGKLEVIFGEPGPLEGSISQQRLYAPVAVAVSPKGEILIAENLLNRIQSLTPDFKAKWALYGGAYFEDSSFNFSKPEEIYGLDGYRQGSLWEYHIDFDTGVWRPVRFWWLGHKHPTREVHGFHVHGMQVHEFAGQRFIFATHKTVRIYRQDGDVLRSVARIGGRFQYLDAQGQLHRPKGPFPIWLDLNGDELAQENEISYRPETGWHSVPHISFSQDAEVTPDGTIYWGNFALPLIKIDEHGVPHYQWEKVKVVGPDFARMHVKEGVTVDESGNRYFDLLWYDLSFQQPGVGHWARSVVKCYIQKYSNENKLLWQTSKKAPGILKLGEMYHPTGVEFAGGYLFVSDEPGLVHVYDPDGIFVATLLLDMTDSNLSAEARRSGVLPKMAMTIGEFWQMRVVQHSVTKKIYIVGQSHELGEHLRVYEVVGLDRLYRAQGTVKVAKQRKLKSFLTEKLLPTN